MISMWSMPRKPQRKAEAEGRGAFRLEEPLKRR